VASVTVASSFKTAAGNVAVGVKRSSFLQRNYLLLFFAGNLIVVFTVGSVKSIVVVAEPTFDTS
jgi:hypothetical protein